MNPFYRRPAYAIRSEPRPVSRFQHIASLNAVAVRLAFSFSAKPGQFGGSRAPSRLYYPRQPCRLALQGQSQNESVESRFSAFCAAFDALVTEEERGRARAYVQRRGCDGGALLPRRGSPCTHSLAL